MYHIWSIKKTSRTQKQYRHYLTRDEPGLPITN